MRYWHVVLRYTPSATDRRSEVGFRMRSALLGLAASGLLLGFSVSAWVPLLPSSIGALGCSVLAAYVGTYRDGLGDLFRYVWVACMLIGWFGGNLCWCRFLGSTFVAIIANTYSAANEVGFTTKLSLVVSQIMAFYSTLDGQLGLTSIFSSFLERVYGMFSLLLSRRVQLPPNCVQMSYSIIPFYSILT